MVAPGMLGQQARGQQGRRRRARQPAAQLVDDEDPVGVAVEGEPDVEPTGHHAGLEVELVGGLDRVGRVVRERAVELAVHHLQLTWGRRSKTLGTTRPPIPLAVSATTWKGATIAGSMNDTT